MSRRRIPDAKRNLANIAPSALERFHASYRVDEASGCWVWIGQIIRAGYGNFNFAKRKFFAHRASWEIHNGPIPEGLLICHHCDNPPCCNPGHLFLGTRSDNVQDAMAKGRMRWKGAPQPGTKNPMAKLTESQVREIKASTGPQKYVATAYGVSPALIHKIRDGHLWPHIPIPADRGPIEDGRRTRRSPPL